MKKNGLFNIDWGLLLPVIILVILSLTTLFSINVGYFKTQLMYVVFSLFVFFIFSNVNYNILKFYPLPIYILSLVVLLIVLFLGIESRGAVRWVEFFGIRIQFSEIFKPFLAIAFAAFLSNKSNLEFKNFVYSLMLILPIVLLIFLQPDLGSALIYSAVSFFTLLVFGFRFIWFMAGLVIMGALSPVIWNFLHDYQRQRILTFINPTSDPLGTSYNAIQSMVAVGSGMFLGKGLGEGTQSALRFLPERHTDFIFATFTEEFGLIGGTILILMFCLLLYKIYMIFVNSDDRFCKIFVACSFFLILVQFFFNVGMNLGLLPVVGITLPFVSYGGSSILSNFIIIALLSAMSKNYKDKKILEIR